MKSPEIIMPIREYVDKWIEDLKNSQARRNREWCYSDALFVAPPTVAMLGHITGEGKYYEWLNQTYWHAVEVLQDKEDGFFYRDHRFIGKRNENGKKIFWSRGNGWVIAGIPRILEYLPKDNPYFARYTALLRQLAREAKDVQGEDGLWRPNLADSERFSMPETSGSAFFCSGIAWGICEGYLDPDDYIKAVKKGWRALVCNVGEDGKLYYVQDVGDRPEAVEKEDTHEYGMGAFMLAGEQVIRLKKAGYLD
jgi:rhamnogalacturonyl hydrolase YesR